MVSSPNHRLGFLFALALSYVLCGCDGKVEAQRNQTEVKAEKSQAFTPAAKPPVPPVEPESAPLPPKRRHQLMELVHKLVSKEHGERALGPLSTLLASEPNNVELLTLRAKTLIAMGEEEKARDDLDRGLTLEPENFELNKLMADYLFVSGNNKSARKCLEICLKMKPRSSDIYGQLGQIAAAEGRYQEAADNYGKAAQIDDKNPMWKRKQAYCYWGMKDYPRAMRLLLQCKEAHKHDFESYVLQAELYEKMGETEKSLAAYRDLFKEFPKSTLQMRSYGLALTKAKHYDEAIEVFSKLLKLNPQDEELYSARAKAYLGKKQMSKALDDVEESIRLSPRDNAEAYRLKAQLRQATAAQGEQNDDLSRQ
ncbi:MAG: tetratricopeptide repeat protein [Candidatus Melainabacteria bacterium]|nr:tetratricopeptide repeat protein [Candidatus Melainabacteria bacterium]